MSFANLHLDIYQLIFDYLSQQELLDLLLINHTFYQQIMKYIPKIQTQDNINCIINDMIIPFKLSKQIVSEWEFTRACQFGRLKFVNWIIKKGVKHYWLNEGLYWACNYGKLDCIKLLIEKGANDFDDGLYYACNKDKLDCVKLLIEKGAKKCKFCSKSIQEHLN